jgi:transcriptional regulator with XRE-family HTH domain
MNDTTQKSTHERLAEAARTSIDYRIEQVIDEITEAIVEHMERKGLSRREFAAAMGVSPARVTRLLRGNQSFSLATLVLIADAMECDLSIALIPKDSASRKVDTGEDSHFVAAEAAATYRVHHHDYRNRDEEIRAHLASGKLRIENDRVYMRHETDGSYRPARFRRAGAHSEKTKTSVGSRSYYRDRIITVARGLGLCP